MMKQGRSFSGLERNCSFLNTGASSNAENRFATISASSGIDFPDDGRALVPVDWDHDGDLDLWISARNAPRIRFLNNNSPSNNHYLAVKLLGNGDDTNRDAIGARIEVVTSPSDGKNVQSLRAGEGFLSQESKWVHFGLGQKQTIDHIVVHWPGGEKEIFTGMIADNRYNLKQGTSIAKLVPKRESSNIESSEPIIPGPSQQARIPLLTKLPKTNIDYLKFDGTEEQVTIGLGSPTLITLWAGWCPTCKLELTEFTERQLDLKSAGINIIALSVDALGDDRSDLDRAIKLLGDLNFPFPTGIASHKLISELQALHDLVIPLKHPLPVPTSFLIDGSGRISVIYKGQAVVDDIIRDAKVRKFNPAESLQYAAPIKGRSINEPLLDKVFLENQARALFFFGTHLLDRKQVDDAILYFLDALELKPDSYKTHYNLGLAYKTRNNLQSALYHFNEAVISNPDLYEAHQVLGGLLMRLGQFDKAKQHYLKHLTAYPKNIITLTALGVLAANQGDLEEAKQRFSQAIAIEPHLTEAQYNLGALLLSQGKTSEAESIFLSILKVQSNYPDIHYNLGIIYENRKDTEKAAYFFLKELRIRPDSVKTLTAMGRLMEHKGNHLQANNYFNRAIALEPNFPPALDGLARLRDRR